MKLICVGGVLCIATQFSYRKPVKSSGKQFSTSLNSSSVTGKKVINGSMLLFKRPEEKAELFSDSGKINRVDIDFFQDGTYSRRIITIEDTIFTEYSELGKCYQKCEGAYVEFIGNSISTKELSSDEN